MSKNTNFHTYRNFLISFTFIFSPLLLDEGIAHAACSSTTSNSVTSTSALVSSGNGNCLNNTATGIINIAGFGGGMVNGYAIDSLINDGQVNTPQSTAILNTASITTLTNNGLITTNYEYSAGIFNSSGSINTLNQSGTINAAGANGTVRGILNLGTATITNLNNYGVTTATNSGGPSYGIENNGAIIQTLTNFNTITGQTYGINNTGTITTLNNVQGGNSPLTYNGVLPANYNIIINSPTIFGRLAVTSPSGTFMSFGIYSGSRIQNGTYTSVITGVATSYFPATSGRASGSYGSVSWSLSNSSQVSYIWDLTLSDYVEPVVLTGPSVANTNQSLVNTASALQGTYTLQNSVLANSFSYDCMVFGANNVCVSAGGRNTQVQAANGLNNTSALLIAAYRPHPNYRIGAYADQNLSVSNPGGTVNLGNNTPLIGLFAAWNERLDGTGTEVKVSAAYGQKNTTITRSVVGSGTGASEAGSGSSTLNSQGVQATAKYGFSVLPEVIVSPYVGVRYTQSNMGGYTESTSSSVTAPLTYSALNTNATTALAGVGASYRVIPQVMTFASAGVETDTNTANGTYSATNASIGTLTPVNFNANPVKTRPTATVGAYYDIEKNQRVGITGIYRQEAYQAVSTTTVMATYTIGL
ncbi:autotransporter outer membrane beta-barrel domain-containing protein [Polynucleobacter paneuropaeus]|nr:autotransporter outer membrane beta-barrel domain-containing protein [Polynucleobacter paneuropaeus]MBT8600386.1 autotransporter outer membrane beta-barrel domain-containing protein [Polynucleobacter paneuropaeus]